MRPSYCPSFFGVKMYFLLNICNNPLFAKNVFFYYIICIITVIKRKYLSKIINPKWNQADFSKVLWSVLCWRTTRWRHSLTENWTMKMNFYLISIFLQDLFGCFLCPALMCVISVLYMYVYNLFVQLMFLHNVCLLNWFCFHRCVCVCQQNGNEAEDCG